MDSSDMMRTFISIISILTRFGLNLQIHLKCKIQNCLDFSLKLI